MIFSVYSTDCCPNFAYNSKNLSKSFYFRDNLYYNNNKK